ncbi:AT-rich interactive domain-containing protein 3 [Phtheirospermum japonicum]|uniref:AT-rich interactive domain-containing protein 3 n=1 Tax=Phtheirospermum japonicum TaxID=374723 RepID=A0A830BHX5_9LAMI|nr:AT-rich interactive domain-containing protein 3 [Phtheirospermum japonicum]
MGESDDGTLEEQIAFMKELESFHREKALDFKPPKFYQQPLNCLKLWRAVIRLGGYDTVCCPDVPYRVLLLCTLYSLLILGLKD